jgi:hypothetical protein
LGILLTLIAVPVSALAQSATTGAIAGVVRDTTGAVLPGVTVEAASPALIEKVRVAVTDEQGNYKIIELRPGTYSVTFTLAGFATFKREGIELTTGFTAAANAEMKVGELQETVTVTGASPVVDVQRVSQSKILTRDVIDTVPSGRTISGYAALTLGASIIARAVDVGGNKGEQYAMIEIHGSHQNDGKLNMDGMRYNNMVGTGAGSNKFFFLNQAAVQEINMETGGMTAESENGGVVLNVIPKDGGNTFKFYLNTNGTTGRFQGDNLTDELRARGATASSPVKKIYDFGVGFGGKIVQDKLWFYTAHRWWGAQTTVNRYANKFGLHSFQYAPDLSNPGYSDAHQRDNSIRVTWQASARNKITGQYSRQNSCSCFDGIGVNNTAVPEATLNWHYTPVSVTQLTWSFPMTNKLLIEAGYSYVQAWTSALPGNGILPTDPAITDVSLGVIYNGTMPQGMSSSNYAWDNSQNNQRFGFSYVTGSHALKVGAQTHRGRQLYDHVMLNAIPGTPIGIYNATSYTFRNGVPISLTQWAFPASAENQEKINLGAFAQDQWTLKRLTLNLGVRYDYLNAYVPAQTRPASVFVPGFQVAQITNVPNWKDLSPRTGAAYDLFGNGKTALKGYLSRFVNAHGVDVASAVNPALAVNLSATRTWTDANGNFTPDCNLFNNAANGECGALDARTFGQPVITTGYSDDVRQGFGTRDYTWQGSLGVQHELRANMGVSATYFRTWYGNFTVTDNLAVTSSDYSQYCITAPTDARLGSASGTRMCGLYDINPNKFGQFNGLVVHAAQFGKQQEYYDGFDFSFNGRFGRGGFVQGGVGMGRTVTDNCFVVNSPQQARNGFCHLAAPWGSGTQVKLAAAYPIAFGFQISGNVQNLSGFPIAANYVATNAEVAPSLGRNLAAGAAATVTVPLIPTNSQYENRFTQVDLRVTKALKIGRTRVQGMLDLYNALNAATVLASVPTYGPTWLQPTAILGARMLKFGAQVDF